MTPEQRRRAGHAVQDRINLGGHTVVEVARAAGIDPKTLRALIAGTRWPTAAVRTSLERALGWATGEIFRQAHGGLRALSGFSSAELAGELHHRLQDATGTDGGA